MKLTEDEKHQLMVAKVTLAMPDDIPGSDTESGMTNSEAREIVAKLAKKELEEKSERI